MTNNASGSGTLPVVAERATLEQLAERANQAHADVLATVQSSVERALIAGQALLEAKHLCLKGTWFAWLADHFRGSRRTAQAYMRLAAQITLMRGDAQNSAPLPHDQLRCMLTGLTAGDARVRADRTAARRKQARPAVESQPAVARKDEFDKSLVYVSPYAGYEKVARSLREVLFEVNCLIGPDSGGCGDYARHLFQRLRAVYFGLENLHWFNDWHVVSDARLSLRSRR